MTLGQLLAKISQYGDDTPVIVRTIERDEIQLTVDVTRVKVENGTIVLVGDLDEVNGDVQ